MKRTLHPGIDAVKPARENENEPSRKRFVRGEQD